MQRETVSSLVIDDVDIVSNYGIRDGGGGDRCTSERAHAYTHLPLVLSPLWPSFASNAFLLRNG